MMDYLTPFRIEINYQSRTCLSAQSLSEISSHLEREDYVDPIIETLASCLYHDAVIAPKMQWNEASIYMDNMEIAIILEQMHSILSSLRLSQPCVLSLYEQGNAMDFEMIPNGETINISRRNYEPSLSSVVESAEMPRPLLVEVYKRFFNEFIFAVGSVAPFVLSIPTFSKWRTDCDALMNLMTKARL